MYIKAAEVESSEMRLGPNRHNTAMSMLTRKIWNDRFDTVAYVITRNGAYREAQRITRKYRVVDRIFRVAIVIAIAVSLIIAFTEATNSDFQSSPGNIQPTVYARIIPVLALIAILVTTCMKMRIATVDPKKYFDPDNFIVLRPIETDIDAFHELTSEQRDLLFSDYDARKSAAQK